LVNLSKISWFAIFKPPFSVENWLFVWYVGSTMSLDNQSLVIEMPKHIYPGSAI